MPRGVYERKKRRKRSSKTRQRTFVGMYTECGAMSQLSTVEDGSNKTITGHTVAEVRAKLVDWINNSGSLEDSKVVIVEVIEVGHEPPKKLQWDGAKALR